MHKLLLSTLLIFMFFGCKNKENDTKITTKNIVEVSKNLASLEVKKEEEWWLKRHQTILSRLNPDSELILIGNSILHSLDNKDREEVWDKYLDSYKTINMGISGDRTENVIWRLKNGSLENINPKVAVLLIGTNNTDGNHYLTISTPEELAEGIKKICTIINEKLPNTKILLMGILPYGYKPNHRDNINKATNKIISKFPEKNSLIHYVDIGPIFYNEKGMARRDLMPDFLHPNKEGHLEMFKALEDKINELMVK
ncbi:lipase [Polaribacter haliotis]|uniref:Lipase n=1 Tax=Polaribacter haliotis TaxID=1888915 RepID=A0A7L8ACK7_9FLAO|nr:GDSL-type esterase/lipase family protein [Polaribacter haliotis]QOD59743.1 lipase [Polaribacter haliotis]